MHDRYADARLADAVDPTRAAGMVHIGVSVVVPWRATPDREPLWRWLRARWANLHPTWEVVEGKCPPGPWHKGVAVADGVAKASHDLIVVADADVWCDDVSAAVNAVHGGAALWAVAAYRVLRLTADATYGVLQTGQWPADRGPRMYADRPYPCHPGGGLTVLTRQCYWDVPIDPRFTGWGQEDDAWAVALRVMAGPEWRGTGDLWHLWHTPQDRRSRDFGSVENVELHRRYRAAKSDPHAMMRLLAEAGVGAPA